MSAVWQRLYPSSLKGRIILLFILSLAAAQVLTVAAVAFKRQKDFERSETALALAQFAAQVAALSDDPAIVPPAPVEPPLSSMDRIWISRTNILQDVGLAPEAWLEDDLHAALRELGVVGIEEIFAAHETYRDRPPVRLPDDPNPLPQVFDDQGEPKSLPLEAFFAVRVPNVEGWILGRLRSSPPPPPILMSDVLLNGLLLAVVCTIGVFALSVNISNALDALCRATERIGAADLPENEIRRFPRGIRNLFAAYDRMNRRITELLEEKDVMLGAIGHDLRTPLTSLRLTIERMGPPAEQQRAVAAIDQVTRTLEDILEFARAGRIDEPTTRVDLGMLVADIVADYEDRGAEIALDCPSRVVMACRPGSIRRMVENVVNNALAYGGEARLWLGIEHGAAVLHVQDEGPGIPEDAKAALMQPFKRGEDSRSRSTGGSGLGLTIAVMIARAHGGELTLTNRSPRGTLVEIRLPAPETWRKPSARAAVRSSPSEATPARGR